MNPYVLAVFIHIAAAVLLLGTSILGEPAVRAAVRRTSDPRDVRALLAFGQPMAVIAPAAALVILASGIYLASVSHAWSLGWVQVAVAFWVVNAVVAGAVVKPAVRQLAAEAGNASGSIEPRLDALRWSGSWTRGVDIMAANDAAMLLLMSLKPSLGGSLLVVLLANGAVAAGRAIAGAQGPRLPRAGVVGAP